MRHLFFFLLYFISWALAAQASLTVVVTDQQGNPLVGQVVKLENEPLGILKKAVTSEKGRFRWDALPTGGVYTLKSEGSQFFQDNQLSGIQLSSGKDFSVTLQLAEKDQQLEEVAIIANGEITLNALNAEVASEISKKEMVNIPVEGRDITRLLYRLPNISQATGFYPEAPNVSINGANSLYTSYLIDGMDNNENFLGGQRFAMPLGFTQSLSALTNNFSVEYGLTSNGVINMTSRSGTNELSGEIYYQLRPGQPLDASSPFAQRDLSGNSVKEGFRRHQGGFGFGGAIIPDQTFYYINAEYTRDIKDNLLSVPQLGIRETITGHNTFSLLSAKLDHYWTEQLRSSLRINSGNVAIERQGGGLEGGISFPSAGNKQNRNSLNIALKNTYTAEKYTLESHYQWSKWKWDYANPFFSENPNVTVRDSSNSVIALIGHPGFVFDENERTFQTIQNMTVYKGSHQIKVGLQYKQSAFSLFGGGNPNGSYDVRLTGDQQQWIINQNYGSALNVGDLPFDTEVLNYSVELRPAAFEKKQHILSAYVEDQWTVTPALTVSSGLRYDYDNLSKGGNDKGDLDNLAPRIGANYRIGQSLSIRAGYGIYYDKILYAVYSDALQQNNTSSDYKRQITELVRLGILPNDTKVERVTNQGNLNASVANTTYLNGPSSTRLNASRETAFGNEWRILNPKGYQNPYAHQFMVGVQKKLSEDILLYLDAMHNRSYHLFRLRNLNAPAPFPVHENTNAARSSSDADLSRPIPIYSNNGFFTVVARDTLRGIARNIVMTESEGRSNYYALNMTLQKAQHQSFYSYRISYTLSYLENNTEDINFRAMDANNFQAEWGPSINDRRHLLNGQVSLFPKEWISLHLAGLVQSGQPINRVPNGSLYPIIQQGVILTDNNGNPLTTNDLNGDGSGFGDAYVGNSDRYPGAGRNSDRLPWSYTLDSQVVVNLPLSNGSTQLGIQVFNLLNTTNLSGYANNATQSNQIQFGPEGSSIIKKNAGPPRQFQFSLSYLF